MSIYGYNGEFTINETLDENNKLIKSLYISCYDISEFPKTISKSTLCVIAKF